MTEHRHYPATRAERCHRESGWDNPRDEQRDPEPFDPAIDRYAIGTNAVPKQRNEK